MGHGLSPRIPAQCPKWIKATRSGVTTRGISRTFPSRGQGDLGEKARSKLSEGGFGQLPRRNLSEATVGSGPWHSTHMWDAAGPALLENGYPALHEEQRGGNQTKKPVRGLQ